MNGRYEFSVASLGLSQSSSAADNNSSAFPRSSPPTRLSLPCPPLPQTQLPQPHYLRLSLPQPHYPTDSVSSNPSTAETAVLRCPTNPAQPPADPDLVFPSPTHAVPGPSSDPAIFPQATQPSLSHRPSSNPAILPQPQHQVLPPSSNPSQVHRPASSHSYNQIENAKHPGRFHQARVSSL
nr:predicted GPI-anchored protein 58 [Salvelinus alpinus]